jgi:hypothetical protein
MLLGFLTRAMRKHIALETCSRENGTVINVLRIHPKLSLPVYLVFPGDFPFLDLKGVAKET